MAVHDIDTSVWLTSGERPISVYSLTHAHDSIMNEIGQPDIAVLLIKYESGLISIIDIDRDSVYGYDIRIEVCISVFKIFKLHIGFIRKEIFCLKLSTQKRGRV